MLKLLSGLVFIFAAVAPTQAETDFTRLETETLALVNEYRTSKDLPALEVDARLQRLADEHAEKMAAGRTPFGHRGFKARAKQFTQGQPGIHVAENVAKNNLSAKKTAQTAFDGWLRSKGHRKNILGPFTRTAIAIRKSKSGHFYFTQLFAQ